MSNDAREMLATMARMQDEHNAQVHPQWRTQGYEYYRAIWVECAELLDHFGWKWWKKQHADIEQVKLELVDIWHFGLSDLLRANGLEAPLDAAVAAQLDNAVAAGAQPADRETLRLAVETLAGETLTSRGFALGAFTQAMRALPLPLNELFALYIAKNVLNRFRQDHGYKAGTYVKNWAGREDNEHLMDLVATLTVAPDAYADALYEALDGRYAELASSSA